MAYYDALIAKWATLTGPTADPAFVDAARQALASPLPEQPTPPSTADGVPAYEEAYAAWRQSVRDRRDIIVAPFLAPETLAKLDALNALTIEGPRQPVEILAAVNLLRAQGAWLPIKAAAAQGNAHAAAVVDLNDDLRATHIDFSLPLVGQLLTALQGEGLLTAEQAAEIESMSHTHTPWWESAGYPGPLSFTDLEAVFVQTFEQTGVATVLV